MQDTEAIRHPADKGQVLLGEHRQADIATQPQQQIRQRQAARPSAARGFIKDQQPRLDDQRPGQRQLVLIVVVSEAPLRCRRA